MLVLSREKGQAITIHEDTALITVSVVEVNRWRWWRFWVQPSAVLKVEGPEGTSALPREAFNVPRNSKARRNEP